jgi:heptosyltransferase I
VHYLQGQSSMTWRRWMPQLADSRRLAAELRSMRYDLVVDMHGQLRTAILTLATGAPVRIGFDRPRPQVWGASQREFPAATRKHAWQGAREGSWLAYTHRIGVPTLDMHATDRYLLISPMLGLDEDRVDFSFTIPDASLWRAHKLLCENGADDRHLAVIAPGTIWETKHWSSRGFAQVARHLMQKNLVVVLIGSKGEGAVCREVASAAPGVIDLAGKTSLSELAALISRAAICVTNDSGPMHLAVALNRPVVSIFGPTDSIWVGPYGRPDAVLSARLDCSPCYLRRISRCPHGHACMRNVSAESVVGRIEALLARDQDFGVPPAMRLRSQGGAGWSG